MKEFRHAMHGDVPPLVDSRSRVLVLGSMLSPKSSEERFYYAHPQNRFWKVIAAVFGTLDNGDNESRKKLALDNGIALWDVIESCDIMGALDGTIKNVVYNDIAGLLKRFPNIESVFVTGGKAFELLKKYNKTAQNSIISRAIRLPSTSPLNCATTFEELVSSYKVLTGI